MSFDTSKYTQNPYIKGDDLEEGERTILTIKTAEEVTFPSGDTVPVLSFMETEQKLTLNKTRMRKCVDLMGEEPDDWIGQKIALYPIEVQFNGKPVAGVAVASPPKKRSGAANQKPEVSFDDDEDDEASPF